MDRKPATDVFHEWALKGKDEGMERGHAKSVSEMVNFIFSKTNSKEIPFTAIDVGCGNGWVVRILQQNKYCKHATGIDGAEAMILKANSIDPNGDYVLAKLPGFKPKNKYDFIHSMEFLYYLDNPENMLKEFYDNWLENGGWAVIGIDHYAENQDSLEWPNHVGVNMATRTIQQWKDAWLNAGFDEVKHWIAGGNDGVTLVVVGRKL
tara:strand:+ start:6899 stop:7519 length:621 start_codon:yes stop_codon:yes gene_type:complete